MNKPKKLAILGLLMLLPLIAACGGIQLVPTETAAEHGDAEIGGLETALQATLDALPSATPIVVTQDVEETATATLEPTVAASDTPQPTADVQLTNLASTLTAIAQPTSTGTSQVTPTATETLCNAMRYVADVTYPDGSEVAAGATFVKTWRIQNMGTCTWVGGYAMVFHSGERMGGQSPVTIQQAVPPGGYTNISVTLTAPTQAGTYRGNWILQAPDGELFGWDPNPDLPFWVEIVVK